MYILNIIDKINEWLEPVNEWLEPAKIWIFNHHSIFLGIALLLIGIGGFFFLYNSLHRD